MTDLAPMAAHEMSRLRTARLHVKKLYPGVAGEILAKDIDDYISFGYRFGNNSLMSRLVTEIMNSPLP